jgi:hypothetical protein
MNGRTMYFPKTHHQARQYTTASAVVGRSQARALVCGRYVVGRSDSQL